MLLWLAIVACGGDAGDSRPPAVGPDLQIEPQSIDFGLVSVGETATTSLTLRNLGDEAVQVDGVFPSGDIVVVGDLDPIDLGPGEERVIPIRWTPRTTSDVLEAHLDLPVVARPPVMVTVPIVGAPSYPLMLAGGWSQAFGTVTVGCAREVSFSISNDGPGDLTLASVALSGPDEFTWSGVETPLVVAPGASTSFQATFTPTAPGSAAATIRIESDDIAERVTDIVVHAQAVAAPGPVSLSWTVQPRPSAVTSLIAVNAEVAGSIQAPLESFFDVLRDSGVAFRVGIIGSQGDPSVWGPYPYIDDGLSAAESDDAVHAMLDGIGGDEDASLGLLDAALEEHRDWLLDGAAWSSSTLHLTVVNKDTEQSAYPADHYVEQYLEYKGDAGPFRVNGVAGPPPSGCAGGAVGRAESSENLFDATDATGGIFLSICDDLDITGTVLASLLVGRFPLTDPPIDANITVTVDGKEVDSGWTYLPESNAIRFDDKSYPSVGSVVGIEYGTPLVCE